MKVNNQNGVAIDISEIWDAWHCAMHMLEHGDSDGEKVADLWHQAHSMRDAIRRVHEACKGRSSLFHTYDDLNGVQAYINETLPPQDRHIATVIMGITANTTLKMIADALGVTDEN